MSAGLTRSEMAEVAALVADGMDPTLPEERRLAALNAALRISPTTALAMASSFGQHLIGALAALGHTEASTMRVLRDRISDFAER